MPDANHLSTLLQPALAMNAIPTTTLLSMPAKSTFLENDWYILAKHWYPVARVQDITDKPVQVTLLDVDLVVYRSSAGLHIARDICPHRGVPLSKGWVQDDQLICPYHGLHYASNGKCTKIPAQPELTRISERFSLHMFPAVEKYGLLWTSLHSTEPVLPSLDSWEQEGHQPILPSYVDIAGSSGRQVEGFIDVAHFAWIHSASFADATNPVVPKYTTELTDFGLRTHYLSNVSNYPKALQHTEPAGFEWLRVFEVYPPFSATLTVHFPQQGKLCILNAASPVSAHKTRLFVPLTRNFDQTGSLEDVYAFNAQIFAEDQDMIESQKPEDLPLDLLAEAHFEADRSSTTYRRLLANMGLSRKFTV